MLICLATCQTTDKPKILYYGQHVASHSAYNYKKASELLATGLYNVSFGWIKKTPYLDKIQKEGANLVHIPESPEDIKE